MLDSIRRFPIRQRLLGGFLTVLACMAAVVAVVVSQLARFEATVATIETIETRQKDLEERIRRWYEELNVGALHLLADPTDQQAIKPFRLIRPELDRGLLAARTLIAEFIAIGDDEFQKRVEDHFLDLQLYNDRLFNVLEALILTRSVDSFLAFTVVAGQADVRLGRLSAELDQLFIRSTTALKDHVRTIIEIALLVFGVALFLCVALSWMIARSLIGPITALSASAHRVASGQLTAVLPTQPELHAGDEVADLARSVTAMAQTLQRQLRDMNELNTTLETRVAERTAELEARNRDLDSFTYMVSHDLKAPLVSFRGLVGILIEDYSAAFDHQGRHYLTRLLANTTQMERLISDLLALSRVGRVVSHVEPVAVREVVEEVLATLDQTIRARAIQVEIAPLPVVAADRVQLVQVFQNLLSNAVKFMGDQREPRVMVGCETLGDELRFEVRDNGIGIDPAYQERIFTVFTRLKEIEVEGTGVGLAIVKKIVDQAGGDITLTSAKGQGTAFRFTWPRYSPATPEISSSPDACEPQRAA